MNLSHVAMLNVELTVEEGGWTYQVPRVVLFNRYHLTQEEAVQVVMSGEYHPSVLVLCEDQWASLFLNQKEI